MPSAFRRKHLRFAARLLAPALVVALTLALAVAAAAQPNPATPASITLGQALRDIDRRIEERITVDWPALAEIGISSDQPMSLRFEPDVTPREALNVILKNIHSNSFDNPLQWLASNNVIHIATRRAFEKLDRERQPDSPSSPAPAAPAEPQLDPVTLEKLRTAFSLDLQDIELHALFERLGESVGLDFFINWPALKHAGLRRDQRAYLQCTDLALRPAMELLFKQTLAPHLAEPLGWAMVGDVVHVSTQRALDNPPLLAITPLADAEHPDGQAMNQTLDRTLPVAFDGLALVGAFEQLRRDLGVELDVNWEALTDKAVDRSLPVYLHLERASARTVIELLLLTASSAGAQEPAGYAVCPDVVQIDTVSRLKRQFAVSKQYALPANYGNADTQRLLINIRRLADPADWTHTGGNLSKASLSGDGQLTVLACPGVQAQVERLLAGQSLEQPKPLTMLRAEPAANAVIIDVDDRGRMSVDGKLQQWISLRAMIRADPIKRVILRPAAQTSAERLGAIERTVRSALRTDQTLLIEQAAPEAPPR